jgi:hypothetical protein
MRAGTKGRRSDQECLHLAATAGETPGVIERLRFGLGSSTQLAEEMMKFIRLALAVALLVTLSLVRPTWATSWSNDQSDLWWNSSENGWGIQFVQRGSTIFATMFVYDAAGNPTFYVATMEGTKANGVLTFTGPLYTTHGSWFGAVPYNPAAFGGSPVGTMTWVKGSGAPGMLTYSVNNVSVTKTLSRQPIRNDDYTGPYTVGLHFVATACSNPAKNGTFDLADTMTVAQNGTAVSVTLLAIGCTYSGTYSQSGQFGSISGTFSCANGDAGTFDTANMIVTPVGMVMRISGSSTSTGCQNTGQIGGVRKDQ